jgi:hypothetical protein
MSLQPTKEISTRTIWYPFNDNRFCHDTIEASIKAGESSSQNIKASQNSILLPLSSTFELNIENFKHKQIALRKIAIVDLTDSSQPKEIPITYSFFNEKVNFSCNDSKICKLDFKNYYFLMSDENQTSFYNLQLKIENPYRFENDSIQLNQFNKGKRGRGQQANTKYFNEIICTQVQLNNFLDAGEIQMFISGARRTILPFFTSTTPILYGGATFTLSFTFPKTSSSPKLKLELIEASVINEMDIKILHRNPKGHFCIQFKLPITKKALDLFSLRLTVNGHVYTTSSFAIRGMQTKIKEYWEKNAEHVIADSGTPSKSVRLETQTSTTEKKDTPHVEIQNTPPFQNTFSQDDFLNTGSVDASNTNPIPLTPLSQSTLTSTSISDGLEYASSTVPNDEILTIDEIEKLYE